MIFVNITRLTSRKSYLVVMLINSHKTTIAVILDGVGLNNVQNHLSSYLVIVSLCSHGTLTKSEIRSS